MDTQPPFPPPLPSSPPEGSPITPPPTTPSTLEIPTSPDTHPFARGQRRGRLLRIGLIALGIAALTGLITYFVYLNGKGGILVVDTSSDVHITINGQPPHTKSDTRGTLIPVYPGRYRLQITKTNYLPFQEDIQVSRGQTVTIRPAFAFQPTSQQQSADSIDYVRPSLDQTAIFYLTNHRQTLYRMEIPTQVQIPLNDQPLQGVTDVQWSSEPDVALIGQADGTYLREIPKFDFQNQTLVKLGGPEIEDAIWDPTNPNRIALAYYTTAGEKSLIFTDKTLSYMDRKADLGEIPNARLIWSTDSAYILLIPRSSDPSQNNLWLYTTADGSLKRLTDGGNIRDASFSPDNTTILYETSTNDPSNPEGSTLSIMQTDGSSKVPLGLKGKVSQAAWKDGTSFYLPGQDSNHLTLYDTASRTTQDIAFAFSNPLTIQGMFYFPTSHTLIFYTSNAIYTVNLAK